MQIRAAVLHQAQTPFQIETLTLDDPRDGEVLVRMVASGVCHSDYHLVTGDTRHPLPVVCGHEGAGVVESVGPGVTRAKVGDHVTLSWTPDCGHCFYCERGQPNLCETYTEPIWKELLLHGRVAFAPNGDYSYVGSWNRADNFAIFDDKLMIAKRSSEVLVNHAVRLLPEPVNAVLA